MADLNSKEYKDYLEDQAADGFGGGHDGQYLRFFFENWATKEFHDLCNLGTALVLDVGCRSFDSWEWWQQHCGIRITGVDVGRAGMEYCEKQNKMGHQQPDGRGAYLLDAHRLLDKFEKNSFDLVTAFHSFEHMFDLPLVLRNCCTVLKPGGLLYFSIPLPSYNWRKGHWYEVLTEEHANQICMSAGFIPRNHIYLRDCEIRPQPELLSLVQK